MLLLLGIKDVLWQNVLACDTGPSCPLANSYQVIIFYRHPIPSYQLVISARLPLMWAQWGKHLKVVHNLLVITMSPVRRMK